MSVNGMVPRLLSLRLSSHYLHPENVAKSFDLIFEMRFLALEFCDLQINLAMGEGLGNFIFTCLVSPFQFREMNLARHIVFRPWSREG